MLLSVLLDALKVQICTKSVLKSFYNLNINRFWEDIKLKRKQKSSLTFVMLTSFYLFQSWDSGHTLSLLRTFSLKTRFMSYYLSTN